MIIHDISLVTMVYKPTYITFWGHHLSDLSCHHDGAMTIETPPHPRVQIPGLATCLGMLSHGLQCLDVFVRVGLATHGGQ